MRQKIKLFLWWLVNGGLFRNVETIQELSDILVLDSRALLDTSSRLGHEFDIISIDVKFVLLSLGDFHSNPWGHWHFSEEFFSQEVSDLEGTASINNGAVDGEMGVGGTELVSEAESNTLGHVGNVRADSSDSSLVLRGAHPLFHQNRLVGRRFHLDFKMTEVFGKGSSWTGDGDNTGLNGDSYFIINNNFLRVM